MDLKPYLPSVNVYEKLSLKDLLEARDQYHVHLMEHPNVVATAIGMYRVRRTDDYPPPWGKGKRKGIGPRTLESSEVRPYSWPSVLVFVDHWLPESDFTKGGKYDPDEIVPKTLSQAVVTREAYANGNAYLTLSAKGLQLWDRTWASFRNG